MIAIARRSLAPLLGVAGFALAGAVVGFSVVKQPLLLVLLALLVIGLAVGYACFSFRRTIYAASITWVYLQYFLVRDLHILPQAGTWGDEACVFGLLVGSLLRGLILGKFVWRRTHLGGYLLLFTVSGVVSGVINGVSMSAFILGLRGFLQVTLFYVLILQFDYDEVFFRRLILLILGLVLLQFPIALVQVALWNPASGVELADSAVGTFGHGTANMIGLFTLPFIFLAVLLAYEKIITPFQASMGFIAVLGLCLLSGSRVALFMLAIGLALSIIKSKLPVAVKIPMVAAGGLLTVIMFVLAGMWFGAGLVSLDADDIYENMIKNQVEAKRGGGRVYWFLDTLEVVNRHAVVPAIGLGPGAYASYAGFTTNAPLLIQRLRFIDHTNRTGFDPDITALTSEFGWVGLLLFLTIIFKNQKQVEILIRDGRDGLWRALAASQRIFTMVMVLGPLTNGMWQAQFVGGTYWLLNGLLEHRLRYERENPTCEPCP